MNSRTKVRTKARRVPWALVAIFIAALALVGFYIYSNQTTASAQQKKDESAVKTATVRRGELVVSATGSGTVIPAAKASVGFSSGGVLSAVNVKVGDKVAAGAILARVDDTSARVQVAQSELSLRDAQLQLDKLKASPTAAELAAKQSSLASAQATLENRLKAATDQEMAAAQQNLLSAQQRLTDLLGGPTAEDITIAQADLELASVKVQQAQAAYDKVALRPDVGLTPQAAALQEATLAYQKAKANYDTKTKGATDATIASARASVAQAQEQLNTLTKGATAYDRAAAQAAVAQAQAQLDETKAGATAVDLELAQNKVKQAENSLALAKQQLNDTAIYAPFSGVVTAVSPSKGERVGTAAIITIADLGQPLVEAFLNETDLAKVGLNFEVEVVFDALPDQTFTGRVVQVDPQLTVSSGVTAVRAVVQLDATSFAKPQTLPSGLNASVEVIGGRATQALLVPVEALRQISPGQYAVFVMENGEPTLRMVQVGLMDYTNAEIKSGLKQGDVVTTGVVATK